MACSSLRTIQLKCNSNYWKLVKFFCVQNLEHQTWNNMWKRWWAWNLNTTVETESHQTHSDSQAQNCQSCLSDYIFGPDSQATLSRAEDCRMPPACSRDFLHASGVSSVSQVSPGLVESCQIEQTLLVTQLFGKMCSLAIYPFGNSVICTNFVGIRGFQSDQTWPGRAQCLCCCALRATHAHWHHWHL